MEVHRRLERLRRRAELEQRLLSSQPGGLPQIPDPDLDPDPDPVFVPVSVPEGVSPPSGPIGRTAELSLPEFAEPDTMELKRVTVHDGATGAFLADDAVAGAAWVDDRPMDDDEAWVVDRSVDETRAVGAATPAPEPLAPMVYDVLAALRLVFQRYPGITVGVWPPGRSPDDPTTAVRFTMDPESRLSLQMPDTSSASPAASPAAVPAGSPAGADDHSGSRSVAVELASLLRPDGFTGPERHP